MHLGDGLVGIAERKRALRREARARRAELTVGARAAASRDASWHVLRHLPWRDRPKVALSWPLADELDTRPLLHALHWLGAEPLLPRMQGRGRPLVFHRWTPGMPLVEGPMRVLEPAPGLPAVVPGIVLAPLLAFDRRGRRLGYGAGFYDMTFAAIAAAGGGPVRAGLAFACQEVDAVPADDTDVPLELVVTEAGCLPAEGPPSLP
jgi:5-formyltetrahydrofolate cyclo-ligase